MGPSTTDGGAIGGGEDKEEEAGIVVCIGPFIPTTMSMFNDELPVVAR